MEPGDELLDAYILSLARSVRRVLSCSNRTSSTSAVATPPRCWPCGAPTAWTRSCEALDAGVVLAGVSAGMNCWFEASTTDSFGPTLMPLHDGLGFVTGSACPHYDGDEQRRPLYHRLVAAGFPSGWAADDGTALRYDAMGELVEAVASREGARGYRVERRPDGAAIEQPLPTRYLW